MRTVKLPFFSFLVPTRDRPEIVGYALESLRRQTFRDFEVVVSDNFTIRSCKDVYEQIADERFRYVTPSSPLSMDENWEYALRHARGEYVGVLIDKTVLLPSTLQAVSQAVQRTPAEIVSWWNENYYLTNEKAGYELGAYNPTSTLREPEIFDPFVELQRRFSFEVRRGHEGRHYFLGKICFGVYHRRLVERITHRLGRLFEPLSPDYTSMVSALALATSALDMGRPFLLSFVSTLSTGASAAQDPQVAKKFLTQIDPNLIEALPLQGLYASNHNGVAYDYLRMQQKLGGRLGDVALNFENLVLRAREDLEQQRWGDTRERLAQEAIIASHLRGVRLRTLAKYQAGRAAKFASHSTLRLHSLISDLRSSVCEGLRSMARPYPRGKKLLKTILGMTDHSTSAQPTAHAVLHDDPVHWQGREPFTSIIEAAEAADNYCAACLPKADQSMEYVDCPGVQR